MTVICLRNSYLTNAQNLKVSTICLKYFSVLLFLISETTVTIDLNLPFESNKSAFL